jgi:hypothetical protein
LEILWGTGDELFVEQATKSQMEDNENAIRKTLYSSRQLSEGRLESPPRPELVLIPSTSSASSSASSLMQKVILQSEDFGLGSCA